MGFNDLAAINVALQVEKVNALPQKTEKGGVQDTLVLDSAMVEK